MVCLIWENELKGNAQYFFVISSSPRLEKVKKFIVRVVCTKKYHLCNTDEWMRKLQRKIRHRSSTWKQQEVHLLHWMNFRWKTSKIVAGMKKWSTRGSCVFTTAFHWYITCSILVSGWRATSSGWRSTSKKITWKTEWSSGTRTEKFRFFRRCIFEESVSR